MAGKSDEWWLEWLGPSLARARRRPHTALYGFEGVGRHGPIPRCDQCGSTRSLSVVRYGVYRCHDSRVCELMIEENRKWRRKSWIRMPWE